MFYLYIAEAIHPKTEKITKFWTSTAIACIIINISFYHLNRH